MPIETKRFRSWASFKADFEHFLPPYDVDHKANGPHIYSRYLFRGQMRSNWDLISSFDRAVPPDVVDRAAAYRKWDNFFRSLHSQLGSPLSASPTEVAALAQHYGMPTRLLDFSLSPYIAAFFAFFDALRFRERETSDVAIWVLHVPTFLLHAGKDFTIVSAQHVGNKRVRNQLGRFVLNDSLHASLNGYVETVNPQLLPSMGRALIPVRDAVSAINDLLLMGISPVDLYPDHEGVAMYVRLRQLLDGYRL